MLKLQALMSMLAVVVTYPFSNVASASVLAGCMTALVPNLVFARWFEQPYRADCTHRLLGQMYLAQLGRWMLTAVLFALAFSGIEDLEPRALFGAFVLIYILPPLLVR